MNDFNQALKTYLDNERARREQEEHDAIFAFGVFVGALLMMVIFGVLVLTGLVVIR